MYPNRRLEPTTRRRSNGDAGFTLHHQSAANADEIDHRWTPRRERASSRSRGGILPSVRHARDRRTHPGAVSAFVPDLNPNSTTRRGGSCGWRAEFGLLEIRARQPTTTLGRGDGANRRLEPARVVTTNREPRPVSNGASTDREPAWSNRRVYNSDFWPSKRAPGSRRALDGRPVDHNRLNAPEVMG